MNFREFDGVSVCWIKGYDCYAKWLDGKTAFALLRLFAIGLGVCCLQQRSLVYAINRNY